MKTVFVIIARYLDNSGFTVVRAYGSQELADIAVNMITKCVPAMHPEVYEVELEE
jgi:hypothetical protein